MTAVEMIERFVCPGCVCGMDTKCGRYEGLDYGGAAGCKNHVVGTMEMRIGSFALGLPKGFNRAGHMPMPKNATDKHNRMWILCWPKVGVKTEHPGFDEFNVPVWAMEKDGFLFVRTYRPRINEACVEVLEGCQLGLVPQAINVGEFHDDID